MVRTERLELSHLAILEPKSSASTNSATSAHLKIDWRKAIFEGAYYTQVAFFAKFCRALARDCCWNYFIAILPFQSENTWEIKMADLEVQYQDGIATLVMNRPEARNALSMEMRAQLADVLHDIERDDSVRCVVLKGAGDHFMAGGDVKGMGESIKKSS